MRGIRSPPSKKRWVQATSLVRRIFYERLAHSNRSGPSSKSQTAHALVVGTATCSTIHVLFIPRTYLYSASMPSISRRTAISTLTYLNSTPTARNVFPLFPIGRKAKRSTDFPAELARDLKRGGNHFTL